MSKIPPYQPVSCDLHSELELAIMHKTRLVLRWQADENTIVSDTVLPCDIFTREGAEYLLVENTAKQQHMIRLDHIRQLQNADKT